MSEIEIVTRYKDGGWVPFNLGSILHMPLRHACHVFDEENAHEVVAKQSGAYVVNSEELQKKYRVQRKRCTTFADILAKGGDALDMPLSKVGFV